MRGVSCVVACVTAILVLSAPRPAQAAASARLVYVRGPGAEACPGEQAVRSAVKARLGYDPFFAWAHDTLFAEISRKDTAFHAEIKLVDDASMLRGARDLVVAGGDCTAVIDAMALTVSLTIDPSSLIGGPAPAPRPEPAPAPPPLQAPSAEPGPETASQAAAPLDSHLAEQPRSTTPPGPPVSAHAGLGALSAVGTAPSATAGGTVFVGVAWRWLSLDLEGRADLPATGASDSSPARFRSQLLVASLLGCAHYGVVFACPVASGGRMSATSVGTIAPREQQAPWWGAGARGGAELDLGAGFSLRAYAELLAALTPYTLALDGAGVYSFPRWSGDVGIGVAWRFL
jgi:hypothetical protein